MTQPDFNLLITLDVLLQEGSVARAARRLRLSPSAMSRALSRLRETTGDPLLVRAGRSLVPTPRAMALRDRVARLVEEAEAVLRPETALDLSRLQRTFTLRTSDGFVETFGPDLLARIGRDAPDVILRFVQKTDKDSTLLREGAVDLETGVLGKTMGPEVRAQALFRDRFVGVIRSGHPLADSAITPEAYAGARHVHVARRATDLKGPVDEAMAPLGLERAFAMIVGGFSPALALVRTSDLIASVPERHTAALRTGLHSFSLPFAVPGLTVSMFWHPRLDADPAHVWLRDCVCEVCN